MTDDEVIQELKNHNSIVLSLIIDFILELKTRGLHHDGSKLNPPELEYFLIYTPKLKDTTYGSDEYKKYLEALTPAIQHHYEKNRHHPEHFANGLSGMNLIDIVEMFCDWTAATQRHNDGDINRSIELNRKRFGYDDVLSNIFRNTVAFFERDKS